MKLILSLFLFCFWTSLTAQNPSATTGRNIAITLTPLKNTKVYLGSYYGKSMTLADSCVLDANSKGVFRGKNKLTGGIYFVVSAQYTIQFELLMDAGQQFSIVGDTSKKEEAKVLGSPDNDLFKAYSIFSNQKGRQLQEWDKAYKLATNASDSARYRNLILEGNKALETYKANVMEKHPRSLLAMLFHTMKRPVAPAVPVRNGQADSSYPYRYVREHFWDGVLFNDDRLLRTPFFEPKLDDYFKYYISPDADSIIPEVKNILLMARTGKEIYPYLLTKFTNKYMNPEFMGQDKVFVSLYENFYAKGDTLLLSPSSRKTITERAYSLMANQLGNPAPPLNLTDTLGKTKGLYDMAAAYTLVVFYDPNCGHCKEELPRLDSIYRAKWAAQNLKVYTVNIYENELPAWKKFIAEKNLSSDWVHVYQTAAARQAEEKAGLPNYRQLYDIFKTPTVFLLDKDKRILAKGLTIEQFDGLLEASLKGKN
jgi:peroxiredoxin